MKPRRKKPKDEDSKIKGKVVLNVIEVEKLLELELVDSKLSMTR